MRKPKTRGRNSSVAIVAEPFLVGQAIAKALTGIEARALTLRELVGLTTKPNIAVVVETDAERGASIMRTLRRKCPHTKIVLAGASNREETIVDAFVAGAAGVVSGDESLAALLQAIEQVAAISVRPPPSALPALIRRLVVVNGLRTLDHASITTASLSKREAELLGQLEGGAANREIATALGIEVQTVKNHLRRLFRKLHVTS